MGDLIVQVPPGRQAAREYVLDTVLRSFLGVRFAVEQGPPGQVRISARGGAGGRALTWPDRFLATSEQDWLKPSSLPTTTHNVPIPDGFGVDSSHHSARIPILFGEWRPGQKVLGKSGDDWQLHADVLGAAFFFLSRYEEVADPAPLDAHGRFPMSRSLSFALGTVGEPVVDTLVELVGAILERLWPGILTSRSSEPALFLTHDVDRPFAVRGRPPLAQLRHIAGDLLRRRSPAAAGRNTVASIAAKFGRSIPDTFDAWDFIMRTSEIHGLRSTFYFKGGASHPTYDYPYSIEHPSMRTLLEEIVKRGHLIGIHGSYMSSQEPRRLRSEIEAVTSAAVAAGQTPGDIGFRQHYLRWTPEMWDSLEDAGVSHDSSLGWPDRIGFRSGTCRPHSTFSLSTSNVLRLVERPLIVMDVTIEKAIDRRPAEAFDQTMRVLSRCRRPGGSIVLLWHNSSLDTTHRRAWYSELVRAVS